MKKFFLTLCCAAFLFPCEKSFANVCDSAAVLNENTTEMVLKARLAGLAIRVVEEVKEENELIPVDQQAVDNFADTEAAFVEENEDKVYDASEVAPQFPGGMKNLMDYLKNNLKYPRISRDHGSQGRALVKFVVNTDGTLQDIEVFKSTGDTYLDQEAVRLVKLMPRWTPGRQLGKAVRVKFVLPINFRLK